MGVRIVHGPGDLTDDDDRLLAVAPTRHVRWNRVLVWFMRILALCWIAKGLIAWAGILGVTGGTPFELRASGHQATTIYFAVIDLVAVVGLWLTSTWGGVLWLHAVMSHLILAVFFPTFVPGTVATSAFFVSLILGYLAVSWLAARERQ